MSQISTRIASFKVCNPYNLLFTHLPEQTDATALSQHGTQDRFKCTSSQLASLFICKAVKFIAHAVNLLTFLFSDTQCWPNRPTRLCWISRYGSGSLLPTSEGSFWAMGFIRPTQTEERKLTRSMSSTNPLTCADSGLTRRWRKFRSHEFGSVPAFMTWLVVTTTSYVPASPGM